MCYIRSIIYFLLEFYLVLNLYLFVLLIWISYYNMKLILLKKIVLSLISKIMSLTLILNKMNIFK